MRSTKPQPLLPVAAHMDVDAEELVAACRLLAEHRLFGLAWLDRSLVAARGFGELANIVPLGLRITDSVPPLLGLDEAVLELIEFPNKSFEMPNVALATVDGTGPRLNLRIYWMPSHQQFLLLISRVLSTGDLELGLARQVRARMIVEAELAQQSRALAAVNAELTRANRDLAEFADIISHDLKSPLRAMRLFSDDLERSLDRANNGDPKLHAAQIRAQSQRMSRMLTDLLAYSKIGRQTEALDAIDTGALVRSIVGSMPRDNGISIAVSGEWPVIETYAAPLDLILRNLVTNAIAHHDLGAGKITVTANPSASTLEIEIADDGPGIAPEWHKAIFQPFRTIDSTAAAEKSGIGLALVRKAVETTGATLTLVSDPAACRGTTFKLSWPLVPKP